MEKIGMWGDHEVWAQDGIVMKIRDPKSGAEFQIGREPDGAPMKVDEFWTEAKKPVV